MGTGTAHGAETHKKIDASEFYYPKNLPANWAKDLASKRATHEMTFKVQYRNPVLINL